MSLITFWHGFFHSKVHKCLKHGETFRFFRNAKYLLAADCKLIIALGKGPKQTHDPSVKTFEWAPPKYTKDLNPNLKRDEMHSYLLKPALRNRLCTPHPTEAAGSLPLPAQKASGEHFVAISICQRLKETVWPSEELFEFLWAGSRGFIWLGNGALEVASLLLDGFPHLRRRKGEK